MYTLNIFENKVRKKIKSNISWDVALCLGSVNQTRLHGVSAQMTVLFIVIAVSTSNQTLLRKIFILKKHEEADWKILYEN
jgi:hypothetical protein